MKQATTTSVVIFSMYRLLLPATTTIDNEECFLFLSFSLQQLGRLPGGEAQ
jgi:hypothetical protein